MFLMLTPSIKSAFKWLNGTDTNTLIGSILRKISKLPSDGQKTKKLGINGHINISKGHQILT